MPELPDVERARKRLHERCVGHTIATVAALEDPIMFPNERGAELEALLEGRRILGTGRRGKQFWLALSGSLHLLVHFGMTGQVFFRGEPQTYHRKDEVDVGTGWPPRFTKLRLALDDGTEVALSDARRLGRVRTYRGKDIGRCPVVAKLGFDPILDPPAAEDFVRRASGRRAAIKSLLLDQGFSAGVGNWIADEVLYQSRIHPKQPANTLSDAQLGELLAQIKTVCRVAVEADAESSRFPPGWLFHHRWTRAAALPWGQQLAFTKVGGRTSAFVPEVQKIA